MGERGCDLKKSGSVPERDTISSSPWSHLLASLFANKLDCKLLSWPFVEIKGTLLLSSSSLLCGSCCRWVVSRWCRILYPLSHSYLSPASFFHEIPSTNSSSPYPSPPPLSPFLVESVRYQTHFYDSPLKCLATETTFSGC